VVSLLTLLPPEPAHALDRFVSCCLTDGGVWDDLRTSDGVVSARVVERSAERVQMCGRIYEIDDQSLHGFWLELDRSGDGVTWRLHFDVVASSLRRARNAIDSCDRAEDTEWRVSLTGHAEIRDGALVVISGSTRSLAETDDAS